MQLTNMKPIWLKIVRDFKEKGLFERESIDQDKVEPRDHGLKDMRLVYLMTLILIILNLNKVLEILS